ncbi:PhnB protein [Crossiella equi]|uniref:PhnB protein n=1 Tax=Crossiella equi TaxID=130796 RepID=A0ABS5AP72_9PSEU|nr:hypothetical protein [Crossiella equi]MBP2478366.1 PhnB protein [Crossiella equi]
MSLTPYVVVDHALTYADFLRALGAEVGPVLPLPEDPGRILHAEARIGDGVLYLADSGEGGQRCPRSPEGPVHVRLWASAPDADAAHTRAVAAGEVGVQEDGGRLGGFVDPFDTLWWVSTPA